MISQVIIQIVIVCFVICYTGGWYMDYEEIPPKPDLVLKAQNKAFTGFKAINALRFDGSSQFDILGYNFQYNIRTNTNKLRSK